MNWRKLLRPRRATSAVAAAVAVGVVAFTCIDHRPYRVSVGEGKWQPVPTSIAKLEAEDEEHRKQVQASPTEVHGEFTLHFIEFDDTGWLWNREQTDQILENIRVAAAPRGAVILAFVHGWKHNASVCDSNVACFRDVLRYLAEAERALYGDERRREIIGVYMGWRGAVTRLPLVEELTFWNRKEAAHSIGNGEAIEVLSRLNVIYKDLALEADRHAARSRFVTVGHSMGGAVVFSAVAGAMKDRIVAQMPAASPGNFSEPIDGFGDLVVLVNPAFEASIYRSIAERSLGSTFSPKQTPLLVTVGSKTDWPNDVAFPIGRTLGTLFRSLRDDEQRQATRTSLANYDRYVTHELGVVQKGVFARPDETSSCGCPTPLPRWTALKKLQAARCKRPVDPVDLHFAAGGCFGSAELLVAQSQQKKVHPDNPFMVIRASNDVVVEHNGIFNPTFTDFLVSFVAAAEQKKRKVYPGAPKPPMQPKSRDATPFDADAAVRAAAEARRTAVMRDAPAAAGPAPRVSNAEPVAPETSSVGAAPPEPAPQPAPPDAPQATTGSPAAKVVRDVTDDTFAAAVFKARKPVLVVTWAPWCGPCRIVNPIVKEAAPRFEDRADFYFLNVDDNPEVARRYGITSIPTLLMFRDGALVDRIVGAMPRDVFERFVERNVTSGGAAP